MKRFLYSCIALFFLISCANEAATPNNAEETGTVVEAPPQIGYELVAIYPRDSANFTQGIEYVNGKMLESAGQYGESDIRYTDIKTGKVLKQVTLTDDIFAEGCTMLGGKIYQLTYRENKCLVYDSATLKKIGEFPYSFGEGWGITNNGTQLIISNGSSNLFFVEPISFRELKRLSVTNQYGPVGNLNELELINGRVFANVWQQDVLLKIDTVSGLVVGAVDLADLRSRTGIPPISLNEKAPEVLNGIAFVHGSNRLFVTGKYWPKLIEIKLKD